MRRNKILVESEDEEGEQEEEVFGRNLRTEGTSTVKDLSENEWEKKEGEDEEEEEESDGEGNRIKKFQSLRMDTLSLSGLLLL